MCRLRVRSLLGVVEARKRLSEDARIVEAVTVLPAGAVPAAGADERARGIIAFLTIAFGLAWLPFLPVFTGQGALAPILMPFAPAIACFVVRNWITRAGFGD